MRIQILNGNPAASAFDESVARLADAFSSASHEVSVRILRDLDIKFCTGCWSCWWATPGLCIHRDDMAPLLKDMAAVDLVVWASPLVAGGISFLLKKAQDRFIPLAHPYIELYKGESHHRHRYEHNADVALFMGPGPDDTDEDIAITRKFFERFSLNTRTRLRFAATDSTPLKEVLDAALAD